MTNKKTYTNEEKAGITNGIAILALIGVISAWNHNSNRKIIEDKPYIEFRAKIYTLADRDKDINPRLQAKERVELYNAMGFKDLLKYDSNGDIYFALPCSFDPSDNNKKTCNIRYLEKALEYYQNNP